MGGITASSNRTSAILYAPSTTVFPVNIRKAGSFDTKFDTLLTDSKLGCNGRRILVRIVDRAKHHRIWHQTRSAYCLRPQFRRHATVSRGCCRNPEANRLLGCFSTICTISSINVARRRVGACKGFSRMSDAPSYGLSPRPTRSIPPHSQQTRPGLCPRNQPRTPLGSTSRAGTRGRVATGSTAAAGLSRGTSIASSSVALPLGVNGRKRLPIDTILYCFFFAAAFSSSSRITKSKLSAMLRARLAGRFLLARR